MTTKGKKKTVVVKQKAKSKTKPVVKSNKVSHNGQQMMKAVHAVCSITDPFCSHANGAKYPTGSARSLAYSQKRLFTTSSDAAGNFAWLFLPNYLCFWNTIGGVSGTTCTFSTFATTDSSQITSSAYRVVSFGIKVKRIAPPLTSSGMLFVKTFGVANGLALGTIDMGTMNCDEHDEIPLQDAKDVAIVGRRINPMPAQELISPSQTWFSGSTPTSWVGNGWSPIFIGGSGLPASIGVVSIELVINYEIVLDDSTGLAQIMTPPVPSNTMMMKTSEVVSSTTKSIFNKGVEMAGKVVQKAAIAAIGSYLGVPPQVGYGMAAIAVD
jgi:hypothetical protein